MEIRDLYTDEDREYINEQTKLLEGLEVKSLAFQAARISMVQDVMLKHILELLLESD